MSNENDLSKQTLVGLEIRDGDFYQRVTHKDGRVEFVPVSLANKAKDSITERFKGEEVAPNKWAPADTSILTKKPSEQVVETTSSLSKEDHVRRSMETEALLVQIFASGNSPAHTSFLIRDRAFFDVIERLANIYGDPYKTHLKRMKYVVPEKKN